MGVLKMDWHILVLERVPTLERLQCEPFANVIFHGENFSTNHDFDTETVFYDLLRGRAGELVGMELHVDRDSPLVQYLLEGIGDCQSIEFAPFLTIWFGDRTNATPMGLEAFGDFKLLQSRLGQRAIAFDPENWSGSKRKATSPNLN